jgi:hypothetical protein
MDDPITNETYMIQDMSTAIINIAKQFSRFPAGRFLEDGPNTGARFRDELLRPALEKYDRVIVEMDGVVGYGSSFLEEAFGGLVRMGAFSKEEMHQKIELRSRLKSPVRDAWDYIDSADAAS